MKKQNILTLSHDYQMDKTQIIGKGSTGEVYLGKQLSTSQTIAVKLIRLETIDNEVTDYLLRMEKIALTTVYHENVLKGIKIIENASKCYMITEYCNGGTLKQLIRKEGTLTQQKSLQIIKGILKGYSTLVRKGIVHRDLKPANIMFHNSTPKIIDFGYCQINGYQKPSLQYNVGSPSYMAPESFGQNIYNEKTQIWAIGIILYECLMGKTFDDGKHMSEIFKTIKKYGIPFGKEVAEKSRKVIGWCLEFNPDKRPTALELINFLTEKKPNQPQFIILDKNRKKSNSLYTNGFQSSNLLTKRKVPSMIMQSSKPSSAAQAYTQHLEQPQVQTLRRKISIKQNPRLVFEQIIERRSSRSNSKSKQQNYGYVAKSQAFSKKTETIPQVNRQRITSNYLIKDEYGLNREAVFKTEKYFTGQNVYNKGGQNVSAFNSGLTSPRQMAKKPSQGTGFSNLTERNPESGKHGVTSKQMITLSKHITEEYLDSSPLTMHGSSLQQQKTLLRPSKQPLKKQNFPSQYISSTQASRQNSQYYPSTKPMPIKHQHVPSSTANYVNSNTLNRDRPSSSIYEFKRIMEQKQKPISIFASLRDGEIGQRTCR